jgi:UDP-galactopyranose mutase
MPITLETINAYYGTNFRPFEARRFIESEISKENISTPNNLEERAISQIGRPLYEAFIKGYTQKQWQEDPRFLPISIINRIPVRYDYNESYFFDQWQGIPTNDYTAIFKKMMTSARIDIHLGIDFFDVKRLIPDSCLVFYSGPIDRFFNYKYGKLGWRTLDFERDIIEAEDYQGTSVMNYPESSVPYIRIHEPRHLHTERDYPKDKTLIIKEYPRVNSGDNPYYPINAEENQIILKQYIEEKAKYPNVIFGGRLGDYQYYDMDQTIDMALSVYNNQIERRGRQL